MTTWPPRAKDALVAMSVIAQQREKCNLQDYFHLVLVLSDEENFEKSDLINKMRAMDVEVLYDKGNIRSHKKLIPTIEKYPDNPILVVDDDAIQHDWWLSTFLKDHQEKPNDIIFGQSRSRIVCTNSHIHEVAADFVPGICYKDMKPSSGAAGTLYPAGTFSDSRFFDRKLFMRLSPSSDEVWQWVFATIKGCNFRSLSGANYPTSFGACQAVSLFSENKDKYDNIHNLIASEVPEYLEAIKQICKPF